MKHVNSLLVESRFATESVRKRENIMRQWKMVGEMWTVLMQFEAGVSTFLTCYGIVGDDATTNVEKLKEMYLNI